jgi:DnaK suppressor protein
MMVNNRRQITGPGELEEVRRILEEHRAVLSREVSVRMRDVRAEGDRSRQAAAAEEFAPKDIQDDLDLALIELKAATLTKIERALRLLDDGQYGTCVECGDPIAHVRLRALPFALRCGSCQDAHEQRRPRLSPVRLDAGGLGD